MQTLESLCELFVSNKKKIDELKAENEKAVFDYVSERVKDGDIVRSLRDNKLYAIQLKRVYDAGFFECGDNSLIWVTAYPLKKNGEVAKIGLNQLNINKIEKVTKQ